MKADLRAVGLITSRHVDLVRANGAVFVDAGQLDPLLELRAAATTRAAPAAGFVLGKVAGGGIGVEFIDRTIAGDVVLRTAPTEPNATIRLDRPTVDLRRPPAEVRSWSSGRRSCGRPSCGRRST